MGAVKVLWAYTSIPECKYMPEGACVFAQPRASLRKLMAACHRSKWHCGEWETLTHEDSKCKILLQATAGHRASDTLEIHTSSCNLLLYNMLQGCRYSSLPVNSFAESVFCMARSCRHGKLLLTANTLQLPLRRYA